MGTRMKSKLPKVLHTVLDRPLVAYPIDAALQAGAERVVVVVGHGREAIESAVCELFPQATIEFVVQSEQRGTGHAVLCARPAFESASAGDLLLVLNGDLPNLRPETARALVDETRASGGPMGLLTAHFADPSGYGRIVRSAAGAAVRVVEERDASATERELTEGNVGTYVFEAAFLQGAIDELSTDNAQGELYLTDLVAAAAAAGTPAHARIVADEDDVLGVNNRADLARVERIARDRRNHALMLSGVTMRSPETTWVASAAVVEADVELGANVSVRGASHLASGVVVETGCVIRDSAVGAGTRIYAYSHLDGAVVGAGCNVGPYGRLRPGSVMADTSRIGNFVEMKKTTLGRGSKVNHLSYIGDATVGSGVNVGAGTITCNYDGVNKHPTTIADGAFIGSNTELVAPVSVGAGAYVGAGSTITDDVPDDALGLGRARQRNIEGYRERRAKRKGK